MIAVTAVMAFTAIIVMIAIIAIKATTAMIAIKTMAAILATMPLWQYVPGRYYTDEGSPQKSSRESSNQTRGDFRRRRGQ